MRSAPWPASPDAPAATSPGAASRAGTATRGPARPSDGSLVRAASAEHDALVELAYRLACLRQLLTGAETAWLDRAGAEVSGAVDAVATATAARTSALVAAGAPDLTRAAQEAGPLDAALLADVVRRTAALVEQVASSSDACRRLAADGAVAVRRLLASVTAAADEAPDWGPARSGAAVGLPAPRVVASL